MSKEHEGGMSRREMLSRVGRVAAGASLAGFAGLSRLSDAVASEMAGSADAIIAQCTGTSWYGCSAGFACSVPTYDCTPNLDHHSCVSSFVCPNGGIVACQGRDPQNDTFTCDGEGAYGCTLRTFRCNFLDTGGMFYCENGGTDAAFHCSDYQTLKFFCGSEQFSCTSYHMKHCP